MKSILLLASLALSPVEAINVDVKTNVEIARSKSCSLISSGLAGDVRVCIYKCDGQVTNVTIPAKKSGGRVNTCPRL